MQGATTIIGILDFPVSANIVSLNQDTVVNFSLPALPGQVTISGRVTDGGGQPVSGVGVAAFSQSITGATNLGFTAGTQTDANGNYSIVVLSGTNYQVIFVPPTPTL
jgi:phage baseplate assembly protein gpV